MAKTIGQKSYVFFHALAEQNMPDSIFMCEGIVDRLPKPGSNVYKVIILSVDPISKTCGNKPQIAKSLLGRRIAREEGQIFIEYSVMMQKVYSPRSTWLTLSEQEKNRIVQLVDKKKDNVKMGRHG